MKETSLKKLPPAAAAPRLGVVSEDFLPGLREVVQGQTGMLRVRNSRRKGVIYFHNGNAIHATTDELNGRDAVLEMASFQNGQMAFVPNVISTIQTIEQSTDALMEEASRYSRAMRILKQQEFSLKKALTVQPGANRAVKKLGSPLARQLHRRLSVPASPEDLLEEMVAPPVSRVDVIETLAEMAEANVLKPYVRPRRNTQFQKDTDPKAEPSNVVRPDISVWAKGAIASTMLLLIGFAAFTLVQNRGWIEQTAALVGMDVAKETEVARGYLDRVLAEMDDTIAAARKPVFGRFRTASRVPLTPPDIQRLLNNGYTSQEAAAEIQKRGFTGFPDSHERKRALKGVEEGLLHEAVNNPANILNRASLAAFIQNPPPSLERMNLAARRAVNELEVGAEERLRAIERATTRLQTAEAAFAQEGLDPIMLEFKQLLLRQEQQALR